MPARTIPVRQPPHNLQQLIHIEWLGQVFRESFRVRALDIGGAAVAG